MGLLNTLQAQVKKCRACEQYLPFEPRPVVQLNRHAKILISGQAPGIRAHQSGRPFDDPSGDRLREWMGISREAFYESGQIAVVPMAFCYPGTGSSGDLPPRKECQPIWQQRLLQALPGIELQLIIGQYAQRYHCAPYYGSVTHQVSNWKTYWPKQLPLPHPSPRNNHWLKRNEWFEREVIPQLRARVTLLMAD